MSGIEMDAGTFAAIIREQKGLPITDAEAEAIAPGTRDVSRR